MLFLINGIAVIHLFHRMCMVVAATWFHSFVRVCVCFFCYFSFKLKFYCIFITFAVVFLWQKGLQLKDFAVTLQSFLALIITLSFLCFSYPCSVFGIWMFSVLKIKLKVPKTSSSWSLNSIYSNSGNFVIWFYTYFLFRFLLTFSQKCSDTEKRNTSSLVVVNGLVWILVKDFVEGCLRRKICFNFRIFIYRYVRSHYFSSSIFCFGQPILSNVSFKIKLKSPLWLNLLPRKLQVFQNILEKNRFCLNLDHKHLP